MDADDIPAQQPHSEDAEKGLLGSILRQPAELLPKVGDKLRKADLYLPAHQLLWTRILELRQRGTPVDYITLTQLLNERKELEYIGGSRVVSDLYTCTPTAANWEHYLEIVLDKATRRDVIRALDEAAGFAWDESEDIATRTDAIERTVLASTRRRGTAEKVPDMEENLRRAIDVMEKQMMNKGKFPGLATGLRRLDLILGGMRKKEMTVIAARPSEGKSAILMQIAAYVAGLGRPAEDPGVPVAVFSLEMGTLSLTQRMLAATARVNLQRMIFGDLYERELQQMAPAARAISHLPLHIDDKAGLSIGELRSRARRFVSEDGVQAIFVDYLQRLRSDSRQAKDNRQIEVAEIAAGLKDLAKELDVPVITAAQLNREGGKRSGGGKPRLADLRESGAIEQEADVVALLYRPEYHADDEEEKKAVEGEAELIIAKNRNGPCEPAKLTFLREFTKFEDRAYL